MKHESGVADRTRNLVEVYTGQSDVGIITLGQGFEDRVPQLCRKS